MAGNKAAVLSGGGAKGAFQVGVLDELISNRGVSFDIFSGVSTGAIQALGGAMNDMPALLNEWLSIKGNSDIYRKRPLGVAGAIFGADSLYDAGAIKKRLKAFADIEKIKKAKKKLRIGIVSLPTGNFVEVDEKNPHLGDWVYASCAQPPYFQPQDSKDANGVIEQWVDGGVRNITPLSSTMKLNPSAVLVILADPPAPARVPGKVYGNLIEIGLRCVGIQTSEIAANDVANATMINSLLAARETQLQRLMGMGLTAAQVASAMEPLDTQLGRYNFAPVRIIAPPADFVPADTLEFNPTKIRAAIDAGRKAVDANWPLLKSMLVG